MLAVFGAPKPGLLLPSTLLGRKLVVQIIWPKSIPENCWWNCKEVWLSHISTLCALACLKLKFGLECYRGKISLMRKAMNDSFSSVETEKAWLQASTFVRNCQCKGEHVWQCWFTCCVILHSSFITDSSLSDFRKTTIYVLNWSAIYNFIYWTNLSLQLFSGLWWGLECSYRTKERLWAAETRVAFRSYCSVIK